MAKILGKSLNYIPWEEPSGNEVIWRYSQNPIINRNPIKGVGRIFNSALVPFNGEYIGVFRGDTTNIMPYLYLGRSKDGIHFEFEEEKINLVNKDGTPHKLEYAYDPRVVELEGKYYVIWCDGMNGAPCIGLAETTDFKTFTFLGNPFLPCNRNGVLFPRKIDGKYMMLSRPSDAGHTKFGNIYISDSKDLEYWGNHKFVMGPSWGWWESTKIGAGPAPIETTVGWIMFYHGVTVTCNGMVYSVGVALLDKDDPSKVIKRCPNYILTPEEPYEVTGFVPNVCFPCATLTDSYTGRIAIYYGAADTHVALAFTTVDKILDLLEECGE